MTRPHLRVISYKGVRKWYAYARRPRPGHREPPVVGSGYTPSDAFYAFLRHELKLQNFEISAYIRQGMRAARDGRAAEDCQYLAGSRRAALWLHGHTIGKETK